MSKGYVYILSNPSMPGLVKIGKTTRDVNGRASEIHTTGVPTPFRVEGAFLSPDCDALEERVHSCLPDLRVSPNREFFKMDPGDARSLVEHLLLEQLAAWVEEFAPEHRIVNADEGADPGDLSDCAREGMRAAGMAMQDFAQVVRELRGSEISPAIERVKARRKKRIDGHHPLTVVGGQ